jgi:thiol:disulfide interchange protein
MKPHHACLALAAALALSSCSKEEAAATVNPPAATSEHRAWMTNWEEAKAKAKAENKPILINLTGSDWCGWCIKIEKEVFSSKEFQEFAAANVILMEADFPKKKELPAELKAQNDALKKQYLNGGYPTVYLLDAEGNKLSEDIGELEGGTAAYIKTISDLIAKSKAN